jgi:transglutaminase-like putative cysteine protease
MLARPARIAAVVLLAGVPPGFAAEPTRSRTFTITESATARGFPAGSRVLEVWLPVPQTDPNQTIHRLTVSAPGPVTIAREPKGGNEALYVRVEDPREPVSVVLEVIATRRENAGHPATLSPAEEAAYLAPEPLVPLDGPIKALADSATAGLTTDLDRARALYDAVVGRMRYDKSGTGWGRGDALFACDARRGNCTDFHALIIALARSRGIPARFAIGRSLPPTRGSGPVAGYHCWAELYVRGRGWIPVDASEASKDPSRRDYFFGHHDENRIELSRGRHLVLEPPAHGDPLNFFVDPYAEVDGRPHATLDRSARFADVDPNP